MNYKNYMNENQLKELLRKSEDPKIEFKREWYSGKDKLDDKGWGEFLKDIISLANGNIGFVGKTAYLIVGVSDEEPTSRELRHTFNIEPIGMLSNLQLLRDSTLKKLRNTCSPSLPNIVFEFVEIESDKKLLIIEIPNPADILKLDRDLTTRGMRFGKGTILCRSGQDTYIAGPSEIEALKKEFKNYYDIHNNHNQMKTKQKKIYHNLPQPDYINFVGRKKEIEYLKKLLSPKDRIWSIVIDGVGGIGKSALALEVARQYLKQFEMLHRDERFKAIIWISAKTATLTADGIKKRQQVTSSLNEIFKTIAICLEEDKIINVPLDQQNLLINRLLTRQRTLIIIDNLETIDDERVNSFIRELPEPTKCVVTTRHRIDIADPIRLTGMTQEDSLSLIKQECIKKNVHLTEEQANLLYKRTGGVPLALVWSIAQIGYGFDVKYVLHHLGNAKGDIARYCFEGVINSIKNKHAFLLLICLSLSSHLNSRKYLGDFTNLSELDRDEGLVELEKLSLINKQQNSFSILPLVKDFTISQIKEVPLEILKIIILKISEIYSPAGADAISRIETYFDPEYLDKLKEDVTQIALKQLYEWAEYTDEQGVYLALGALEKLATKKAIENIKYIAEGALSHYYLYYASYYPQDAISILARLGEFDYIFNRIKILINSTDKETVLAIIATLGKYGNITLISSIDELLQNVKNTEIISALKLARKNILSTS